MTCNPIYDRQPTEDFYQHKKGHKSVFEVTSKHTYASQADGVGVR